MRNTADGLSSDKDYQDKLEIEQPIWKWVTGKRIDLRISAQGKKAQDEPHSGRMLRDKIAQEEPHSGRMCRDKIAQQEPPSG
jgi:hypothetical protein